MLLVLDLIGCEEDSGSLQRERVDNRCSADGFVLAEAPAGTASRSSNTGATVVSKDRRWPQFENARPRSKFK